MPIIVETPKGIFRLTKGVLTAGDKNTKLAKSSKRVLTAGLPMMAHKASGILLTDGEIFNACPDASEGCIAGCIVRSGRAAMWKSINKGRTIRTIAWALQPLAVKLQIIRDVARWLKKARAARKRLAIRLNMFSDVAWEVVFPELFELFPMVQFYDYSKSASRARNFAAGLFPDNYHLTFSRSEKNEKDCLELLALGVSVTVVFDLGTGKNRKPLPKVWKGFKVIDGDKTDLRYADPRGSVIGLFAKRTKGFKRAKRLGFFVSV